MLTSDQNKILVIEDDENIRRFITINLERSGFKVAETALGEEGLRLTASLQPDLVVLDIMLPDLNGFDICRKIREQHPDIAILLLTARGQDLDKVMGLELGADDYIVKPFNPLELVARIRAVLRRTQPSGRPQRKVLLSDSLMVDLAANKLSKHNCSIELTPKEFHLLKVFMEHPQQALGRDELLNLVWGEDFVGDPKTVDVHVRRLREKIEDNPSQPEFIETVWGYGYRWGKDR